MLQERMAKDIVEAHQLNNEAVECVRAPSFVLNLDKLAFF